MRRLIPLAVLLATSCSSRPPVSEVMFESVVKRVSEVEDRREFQENFFKAWTETDDPRFRARAALALGRLMKPEGVPFLKKLGADPDLVVRKSALFASGQMGLASPPISSAERDGLRETVIASLKHPDETVRATAIEALGKLTLGQAPAEAGAMLKDPSPAVRGQAASSCFRWRRAMRMRDPEAKPPALAPDIANALSSAASDSDAEVRWRAIHALHQSAVMPELAVLGRFLSDSEPLSRLFALNVVERQAIAQAADRVAEAQKDPEAFVRQAAVRAAVALKIADRLDPGLASDPSHHVREAYAGAIEKEGPELDALSKDASPAVRCAALLTRAKLDKERAADILGAALGDPDPILRTAAVRGAGELKEAGLPLLLKARADQSEAVRSAALVVLGGVKGDVAYQSIRLGLMAQALAERGSAVEALGGRSEKILPDVIECYRNSAGRKWVEIREELIGLLAKQTDTKDFLLEVVRDEKVPSVWQRAADALQKQGVKDLPSPPPPVREKSPYLDRRFVEDPIVVMETTKGTMEIQCFAAHAPIHVANFIGLVEKKFYDGLAWHRVVPSFVIQGGDPDNSGWGDAGWSLRAEINPVLYERGTLGMPRSAGFDTGGCQIFITHIPTPHLDGYYTVFGKVVKGLEVMDKIEIGDKILRASVKP